MEGSAHRWPAKGPPEIGTRPLICSGYAQPSSMNAVGPDQFVAITAVQELDQLRF